MCDSGTNDRKVRCVKETRPDYDDGRTFCIWRMDVKGTLDDLLDGSDIGEKVTLEVCEMTESQLAALPEFEGW